MNLKAEWTQVQLAPHQRFAYSNQEVASTFGVTVIDETGGDVDTVPIVAFYAAAVAVSTDRASYDDVIRQWRYRRTLIKRVSTITPPKLWTTTHFRGGDRLPILWTTIPLAADDPVGEPSEVRSFYLRAPPEGDLQVIKDIAMSLAQRMLRGEGEWASTSYSDRWEGFVAHFHDNILTELADRHGHVVDRAHRRRVLPPTMSPEAVAWLRGLQQDEGAKEVFGKYRARHGTTNAPGAAQPSIRGAQRQLCCRLGGSAPSSGQYRSVQRTALERHPLLLHGRERLTDSFFATPSTCTAHAVWEFMATQMPEVRQQSAMKSWPDVKAVEFTWRDVLEATLPTPSGVVLRPLYRYDQQFIRAGIGYVLEAKALPASLRGIAVDAIDAIAPAIAESISASALRPGAGCIDAQVLRFWDWRSAYRASLPSVDKVRHAVRRADGSIVQHAMDNMQIVDAQYNRAKGSLSTALEADCQYFAVLVNNLATAVLGPERVAAVIGSVAEVFDSLSSAAQVSRSIANLGQASLRATTEPLKLLGLGDAPPGTRVDKALPVREQGGSGAVSRTRGAQRSGRKGSERTAKSTADQGGADDEDDHDDDGDQEGDVEGDGDDSDDDDDWDEGDWDGEDDGEDEREQNDWKRGSDAADDDDGEAPARMAISSRPRVQALLADAETAPAVLAFCADVLGENVSGVVEKGDGALPDRFPAESASPD